MLEHYVPFSDLLHFPSVLHTSISVRVDTIYIKVIKKRSNETRRHKPLGPLTELQGFGKGQSETRKSATANVNIF